MNENGTDLRYVLRILNKRKGLILRFFLGATLLALSVSLILPPTYEAESTLRVKQAKGLSDSLLGALPGVNDFSSNQLMNTYQEIMNNRAVVTAVIDRVYAEKPEQERPRYEDFLRRVTIQPLKDTEILKVKVTAREPEEAAVLTNTLVEAFNERLTELVRTEQRAIRGFIGKRLVDARGELEKAEADLESYKREQKILAPAVETTALVGKLSDFDKLAANNRVALSMARAKLETAQSQLAAQHPGFVADNPTVQQYKQRLVEQEVQLVELLQRYTEKHPQVLTTRKKIAEIQAGLAAEAAKVATLQAPSDNLVFQGLLTSRIQAEAEVAGALAQQEAIRRVMADGEKEIAALPAKEKGLARLLRDATVAQEIYVMLAKRHEEARIAEVMEATDVQLVNVAAVPEKPVQPQILFNTLVGAFLGLLAGLGRVFFLERFHRRIRTEEDVRSYLELPLLGSILAAGKAAPAGQNPSLIIHEAMNSPAAEAYRMLRAKLQFCQEEAGKAAPQSILFTTAGLDASRSAVIANTAVILAQAEQRVVLVDCDLRKPRQHELFGLGPQGVTDYLVRDAAVDTLLQPTGVPNLTLLASGPVPANPAELLGSAKMSRLLSLLKERYDCVLLQTPSVAAVADAATLASRVDGVVLELTAGVDRPERVKQARDMLVSARARLWGAVLNGAEGEADYRECAYYDRAGGLPADRSGGQA